MCSGGIRFFKNKDKEDYRQKIILAHEIHKVLDHLMFDLHEARENTIYDVPANGQWYSRIVFAHAGERAWSIPFGVGICGASTTVGVY